jgi:hypothetical protein
VCLRWGSRIVSKTSSNSSSFIRRNCRGFSSETQKLEPKKEKFSTLSFIHQRNFNVLNMNRESSIKETNRPNQIKSSESSLTTTWHKNEHWLVGWMCFDCNIRWLIHKCLFIQKKNNVSV